MTTFSMNLTVENSSAARSKAPKISFLFPISGSFLCRTHVGVYYAAMCLWLQWLHLVQKIPFCSLSPIFSLFHSFCLIFCNVILVLFWIEPLSITYSGHLMEFLHPLSFTGKNLFWLKLIVIFLCAYRYKYFKSKLMTSQFCSITVFSYITEHGFSPFWSLSS